MTTVRGDSRPQTSGRCSEPMTLPLIKRRLQFISLSRIISVSERSVGVLSFNNKKWGIKTNKEQFVSSSLSPRLSHTLPVFYIHTPFSLLGTPASSDNIKVTMALGAKLGEKPSTSSSPRWSRRIWEEISLNSCEPSLLPLAHC